MAFRGVLLALTAIVNVSLIGWLIYTNRATQEPKCARLPSSTPTASISLSATSSTSLSLSSTFTQSPCPKVCGPTANPSSTSAPSLTPTPTKTPWMVPNCEEQHWSERTCLVCDPGYVGPNCTALPLCNVSTPISGTWRRPKREPRYLIRMHNPNAGNDCHARSLEWNQSYADFFGSFDPYAADDVFVPDKCRLHRQEFGNSKWMWGRQLFIMGDSLSLNHWLQQIHDWEAFWQLKIKGVHNPRITKYYCSYYFPTDNATDMITLCHAGAGSSRQPFVDAVPEVIATMNMTRRDIIVMNEGLHGPDSLGFRCLETAEMLRTIIKTSGDNAPLFLWRESFPQHFNTPDGIHIGNMPLQNCVAHSKTMNSINHESTPMFVNVTGVHILYVYGPTVPRYMEHNGWVTVRQGPGEPWDRPHMDCTHYCIPSSPLRFATEMIYHHVMSLRPQY